MSRDVPEIGGVSVGALCSPVGVTEQDIETPVRVDLWLLRHHITLVVEWAVQAVGRAALVASLVAGLLALAGLSGSDGGLVLMSVFAWLLVFGVTLFFSNGPFPIKLAEDDDQET